MYLRQALAVALLCAGLVGCDANAPAFPPVKRPAPTPVKKEETRFVLNGAELRRAKQVKGLERANPDSQTVCLNLDGTLAARVLHTREGGAPPIPVSEKERICRDRSAVWQLPR